MLTVFILYFIIPWRLLQYKETAGHCYTYKVTAQDVNNGNNGQTDTK